MPTSSRLRPYRLAAIALSAVLLVGVAGAMLWSIRVFTHSTDLVKHSFQVMNSTEVIRSAIRAAESNARGFRMSGRPQMQHEYESMLPVIQLHTSRLIALTADSPTQHLRAQTLQAAVTSRLRGIADMIEVQQSQGTGQALALSRTGKGFEQMLLINDITDSILAEEQGLLAARSAATTRQAWMVVAAIVIGIVLPMLLLGVMLSSLIRENRRSRLLERGALEAVRELEESLVQRDRLSEQRRILGAYAGLLQSCQTVDEAMRVTAQVVTELLPGTGGRCYVLRASQNLAEAMSTFGESPLRSDDMLEPDRCWALRRGQPHHTGGRHGQVRCTHVHGNATSAEGAWTLCVPLIAQGNSLGLLHVSGDGGSDGERGTIAEAVAEQLSLAMMNLQLRETLRVQSLRDSLTGLFNRRYLEENLQRELLRCERRGLPLSVIMLDVDHFKRFNDQHGHVAGDALLARVGHTLQGLTRNEDIACRYGGEEFAIVLPETTREVALQRAEEIRQAIASTTVLHMRKTLGPTTASLGVATFPEDGDSPVVLVERADAALYRAKAAGRDRIIEASRAKSGA
ncbi:sensor domain-containing diguanylate cyclase [Lysobacter niastensis]|uniref:diguanylate cyclase n=1 Tax=Lysobacter niastensis TaxID=380629 RepID=A0ABS0B3M4_9GAMM|nr:diguanylate cyclase [Lysobacter niastensis]MBF6022877.1 diguanylate cyclase [Lysobacter niastensis]